jgi:hypothetical protein
MFTDVLVAMSVLVIIVEGLFIGYAAFFCRLRPRISLIDNIIEFIGPVFNISYHFFSAISTSDKVETKGGYDTYLYIILLIFILANLVLAIVALVFAAFRLVRWYRQSSKVHGEGNMRKAEIISDNTKKGDQIHGPGAYVPPGTMQEAKPEAKLQINDYHSVPVNPVTEPAGAVVATNPVLQTEQGAPIVTLQAETNPNPSQTNNIQPTENLQDPSPAQNINEPANPGPSGRLPQPVNPVANPGQSGQLPQPANPVAQPGQSGQLPRPTQPANL